MAFITVFNRMSIPANTSLVGGNSEIPCQHDTDNTIFVKNRGPQAVSLGTEGGGSQFQLMAGEDITFQFYGNPGSGTGTSVPVQVSDGVSIEGAVLDVFYTYSE